MKDCVAAGSPHMGPGGYPIQRQAAACTHSTPQSVPMRRQLHGRPTRRMRHRCSQDGGVAERRRAWCRAAAAETVRGPVTHVPASTSLPDLEEWAGDVGIQWPKLRPADFAGAACPPFKPILCCYSYLLFLNSLSVHRGGVAVPCRPAGHSCQGGPGSGGGAGVGACGGRAPGEPQGALPPAPRLLRRSLLRKGALVRLPSCAA